MAEIILKAPPRRGRLPLPNQGDTILEAATYLFLRDGYSGVSIDAINRRTKGSKRDLYRLFGDKEALFKRVVIDVCRERISVLSAGMPRGRSLEDSLRLAGEAFLRMLLAPRTVAIHRLLVCEGNRFPEIARKFLQEGPAAAYAAFAEVLSEHVDAGDLRLEDANLTARIFLDSLSGWLQLRVLLGESVNEGEITLIVNAAAATFLKGLIT